jgi:hypothetical protein
MQRPAGQRCKFGQERPYDSFHCGMRKAQSSRKEQKRLTLNLLPSLRQCPETTSHSDERYQQMLKGVVSNFLLCSLNYPDMFRHPNAICRWPHRANNSPHPPETQTKTAVAYKERVTPWEWHLDAETCRGNIMSRVKLLTTPLSISWFLSTDYEKCSVQWSKPQDYVLNYWL